MPRIRRKYKTYVSVRKVNLHLYRHLVVFLNDVIRMCKKDWYESGAVCASAMNCIDVGNTQ